MSTTPLSTKPTINALLSTYQWGAVNGQSASLTYSFPTTGSIWLPSYGPEIATWTALNLAQQGNFKTALSLWSDVAKLTFTQVADNTTVVGAIRVAFSNEVKQQGADGWAYYPSSVSKVSTQNGDVWLNPDNTDYSPGAQSYSTLIHELGHALGLKHSFEPFAGNNAVLTGGENSKQYTVMSYTDYQGAGSVYTPLGGGSYSYYAVQPTTPMLYDIAAMQFLYGANMSTRTGNDTYTFSNSHGELKTIWDAGGIDTFDLSNQTLNQTINLIAGKFSSLGVKQTSPNGPLSAASANIAIAYGVSVENAVGGAGNDLITGNSLNNVLSGGAGNDVLNGGAGKDKLNGDMGNDVYIVDSSADTVTELASAGIDAVQSYVNWTLGANLEKLTLLGNGAINGTGNGSANIITGNGANNILNGGLGNDKLIGGVGADTLIGDAGRDVFVFNNVSGIDSVGDFAVAFDRIQLENAVFTSLTSTGILAAGQFAFGSVATDSNDFVIYDKANGALYYDADGSGIVAETQIATLGVNLALTNLNFAVI